MAKLLEEGDLRMRADKLWTADRLRAMAADLTNTKAKDVELRLVTGMGSTAQWSSIPVKPATVPALAEALNLAADALLAQALELPEGT